LSDDGKAIELKVFVNAPYDQYANPGTRFWNASGVDVSVGAGGVEVRTQSLVSLLAGGLASTRHLLLLRPSRCRGYDLHPLPQTRPRHEAAKKYYKALCALFQ
jgi:hypothetical protein